MEKLLLVGGGHAHLHVLQRLSQTPMENVEVVLLSPSRFQYHSSMFPGYAEGIYGKDDIRIDLGKLASEANVKWMEAAVTAVDPVQKMALTSNGEILSFSAISFDIGTLTAGIDIPGVTDYTYRIKPNYHFVEVLDEVKHAERLAIVGGGAETVELALSIHAWRKKNVEQSSLTLLSTAPLVSELGETTSNRIARIIAEKGVERFQVESITRVDRNSLHATDGIHEFDEMMWMNGPAAPGLFKASKLPVDEAGFLKVEETLQVKKYPFIFGAGDCVSGADRHVTGMTGIKQGPVLFRNLQGFFGTGEGELYRAKKNPLAIISLADKEGLLLYRRRSYRGKLAWFMKDRLNRQFMMRY